MRGVGVGVQKADRHRLDPLGAQHCGGFAQARFIERRQHPPVGGDALAHGQAPRALHQRARLVDQKIILVVAMLVGHLQRIAEARGGDEADLGAAPLDHRVGGERGAVHDHGDLGSRDAGLRQQARDALDHRALGLVGRGEQLQAGLLTAALQHEIGEGAANIDTDAGGHGKEALLFEKRSKNFLSIDSVPHQKNE